jgi:transcriptional regulator with GAF, ATPase, and Fis domain
LVIAASKGNLSAAARLLDTTRAKLAFRARKHGLV